MAGPGPGKWDGAPRVASARAVIRTWAAYQYWSRTVRP